MAKLTNFYLNKQNEINLPRLAKFFKEKNYDLKERIGLG